MSITTIQLECLLEEIEPLCRGARVRRVWCRNELAFVLELRVPGRNYFLLLSVEEEGVRLHLVDGKPAQPPEPPPFILGLRRYLEGARLAALAQVPGDRVLVFEFDKLPRPPDGAGAGEGARGQAERRAPAIAGTFRLAAELTGRHANVFLLDARETILDSLLPNLSSRRRLVPGEHYERPAPPRQGLAPPAERDPLDLAALPADGARSKRLREFYDAYLERRRGAALARDLLRRLKREAEGLARRAENVERDRVRAVEAQRYRRFGELLQSAYGKVGRGAASARVPDYFEAGAPLVEVPLEPALDLNANIQRYFKLYRRFSGALEQIASRLEATRRRQEAVDAALRRAAALAWIATEGEVGSAPAAGQGEGPAFRYGDTLGAAEGRQRLEALEEELEAAGILRAEPPPRPKKAAAAGDAKAALPYREFQSRSGKAILVGKGAKQNDALTVRFARGNDLWLHAHDWSGSHVVVRLQPGEDIDEESLLDAATLAAHHSKAKGAAKVEVIYARAKHVAKPKGFPPGMVSVASPKTILVRVEAERLERLLGQGRPPSQPKSLPSSS
jgi:predicted ribosome quality control (RQC) complex YloA/Tae2 family protein